MRVLTASDRTRYLAPYQVLACFDDEAELVDFLTKLWQNVRDRSAKTLDEVLPSWVPRRGLEEVRVRDVWLRVETVPVVRTYADDKAFFDLNAGRGV